MEACPEGKPHRLPGFYSLTQHRTKGNRMNRNAPRFVYRKGIEPYTLDTTLSNHQIDTTTYMRYCP